MAAAEGGVTAAAGGRRRSTKHISIRFHYIRELATAKVIRVDYIATKENIADILTKSLNSPTHFYLCDK